MIVKTSELVGIQLDWAVAKCEGKDNDCEVHAGNIWYGRITSGFIQWRPSTDWYQGGSIIDREKISFMHEYNYCNYPKEIWWAMNKFRMVQYGQTPLIAAMRCYVDSELGNKIEIPEEYYESLGL